MNCWYSSLVIAPSRAYLESPDVTAAGPGWEARNSRIPGVLKVEHNLRLCSPGGQGQCRPPGAGWIPLPHVQG